MKSIISLENPGTPNALWTGVSAGKAIFRSGTRPSKLTGKLIVYPYLGEESDKAASLSIRYSSRCSLPHLFMAWPLEHIGLKTGWSGST